MFFDKNEEAGRSRSGNGNGIGIGIGKIRLSTCGQRKSEDLRENDKNIKHLFYFSDFVPSEESPTDSEEFSAGAAAEESASENAAFVFVVSE